MSHFKSRVTRRLRSLSSDQHWICQPCRSKLIASLDRVSQTQWHNSSRPPTLGSQTAHASRRTLYKDCRTLSLEKSRLYPPSNLRQHVRHISSIPGATTVHAQPEIPYNAGTLYRALTALEQEAALYVDISQLRLVLKGFESADAVTRVALLGVEEHIGVRRLARVLLADPLGKEAEWERTLPDLDVGGGRALLLRYGKHMNIDDRHPLVRTMFIPSKILQNHQLEIFIQVIASQTHASAEGAASLLVPGLDTAVEGSSGIRSSTITYPVHKTLVYTHDFRHIESLPQIAQNPQVEEQLRLTTGVIDGSWSTHSAETVKSAIINPINLVFAESAVNSLRDSLTESFSYEHAWYDSGLPVISNWLTSGTTKSSSVKPTVTRLANAILSSTDMAITVSERAAEEDVHKATVTDNARAALHRSIDTWAEHAHFELQHRLDAAFTTQSWHRLRWWKLPFRADDVPSTLSSLLTKAWLPDSERELIYLSGRLVQSRLLEEPAPPELSLYSVLTKKQEPSHNPDDLKPLGTPKQGYTMREALSRELQVPAFDSELADISVVPMPYNTTITSARAEFREHSVPQLHALAQDLSLQALSTTVLATGISALLYVSISATSVFEAGTVAAIGLVWAARQLQRGWEGARREWMGFVREEGIRVLRVAEDEMRGAVKEGGMGVVDQREKEERGKARIAVERCRKALEEVEREKR